MEPYFDLARKVYTIDVCMGGFEGRIKEPSEEKLPVIPSGLLFMMIPNSPQRLPFGETGMM